MFTLTQVGETFGDCTSSFKVNLEKEYSVIDFVSTVLSRVPEWGFIELKIKNNEDIITRLEYRYGKLIEENFNEKLNNSKILEVKSHGGYSRMDYLLVI